jgi:glycosyltransferase involved in cell wall biosynthesis
MNHVADPGATIHRMAAVTVTVAIPTYGRDEVLVETLRALLDLPDRPDEILIVDQTPNHDRWTDEALGGMAARGEIRWLRLERPSIPVAMNEALRAAASAVVLFLDDDIRPDPDLVAMHRSAHASADAPILVAGRVIQPWEEGLDTANLPERPFRFCSTRPRELEEFMGGNFSLPVEAAREAGGFDENFVRVAYRFEAEFASRWRRRHRILFEPRACVHHLKTERGGTRSFGDHLRTASPGHAVGQYYFLLRARPRRWWLDVLWKPLRAVTTRYHLRHPWWIPPALLAQFTGLVWALWLAAKGPALIGNGSAVRATAGVLR